MQVVPVDRTIRLCRLHHRAYDTGGLESPPLLEREWREEVAHAGVHLGLIGAVRRLALGRRSGLDGRLTHWGGPSAVNRVTT